MEKENVVPMTRTERRLAKRFGLRIPVRVRIAKSAGSEHTAESLNVSKVHVEPNGPAKGATRVGVGFDCYEVLVPARPSVNQVFQFG